MAQAGTIVPQAHPKVFPPFDIETFASQLVWLTLTFGLLYVVMKRGILPRLAEMLSERSDHIKYDLARTENLKRETERVIGDYQQALSDARAKAVTLINMQRERLGVEVEKERATLEAQIAATLAKAESDIAESKSKALAAVGGIATELAGMIITRLIGKEIATDKVKPVLNRRAAGKNPTWDGTF
jgi:F-type H+-transporting ATPase subunit b